MAGQMRWSRDNDQSGQEHPGKDVLLAYIRQQKDAHLQKEYEHISKCSLCYQECLKLDRLITPLKALESMRNYQLYPRLGENFYKSVASGKKPARAKRKSQSRQSKPSLKVLSLPIALAMMVVLFTVLTFAYNSGHLQQQGGGASFSSPTAINLSPPVNPQTPTPTPTHAPTSTPALTPTPTPTPTVTVTATASPTGESPTIEQCDTSADETANRIRICGQGFSPNAYITLIIVFSEYGPIQIHLKADAQGNFQYVFTIWSCRLVPSYIYAQNSQNPDEVSQTLENISVPNCPDIKLTPTPTQTN